MFPVNSVTAGLAFHLLLTRSTAYQGLLSTSGLHALGQHPGVQGECTKPSLLKVPPPRAPPPTMRSHSVGVGRTL
jgi:hypothetical protein